MEGKRKMTSFKRFAFGRLKSNSYEVPSPSDKDGHISTQNTDNKTKSNRNDKKKVLMKDADIPSSKNDKRKIIDGNKSLSLTG